MSEVSEPAFDSDGRVVCPAHIDRDVDALRIEFGKARVELAHARREIGELKGIVTNGLQSDVSEIKSDTKEVKELAQVWSTSKAVATGFWRVAHDGSTVLLKVAAAAGIVAGIVKWTGVL